MNSADQIQMLRELVGPICASHGLDLVDARFAHEDGMVLKVLIEQPGADPAAGAGVTLDDCQAVSRAISAVLDALDEQPTSHARLPRGAYRLEVGSPGLERPLFCLADFARFTGREAKVNCLRPVDGRRRFSGSLMGVEGTDVLLEQDGQPVRIPHAEVAKAHLVYRF